MKRSRRSWFAIVVLAGIFLAANLRSWSLGVGGRTDIVNVEKPKGTELERFFGWPAYYRAELWRSDDQALATKILREAPFYDPGKEMTEVIRRTSWQACLLNLVFAISALALMSLIFIAAHRI